MAVRFLGLSCGCCVVVVVGCLLSIFWLGVWFCCVVALLLAANCYLWYLGLGSLAFR